MRTSWRERILAMGVPTEEDTHNAGEWRTCAIGEQRDQYPTVIQTLEVIRAPVDRDLDELGMRFFHLIRDAADQKRPVNRERALGILDQIECRVQTMKREAGTRYGNPEG